MVYVLNNQQQLKRTLTCGKFKLMILFSLQQEYLPTISLDEQIGTFALMSKQ